jgi:hypothetical protein
MLRQPDRRKKAKGPRGGGTFSAGRATGAGAAGRPTIMIGADR